MNVSMPFQQAATLNSEQNSDLAQLLKGTGTAALVEANRSDTYWGAGISLESEDLWNPSKWKGKNKLGTMLEELRDSM